MRERLILRNWLTQLWTLASPKFVQRATKLKIQVRVDIAVLRPNSFLFWKSPSLLVRLSNEEMRSMPMMEGNLLTSDSWLKCWSLLKNAFPATSKLVFDQTNGHHTLAKLTQINYHVYTHTFIYTHVCVYMCTYTHILCLG